MGLLRIATTGTVAEYVIPALVEAFARRMPSLEIQVGVDSPGSFRELLRLRRADMTIGPDPISELGIECVPFLRYELIVVSGRYNQGCHQSRPVGTCPREWLLGPNDTEPASEVGLSFWRGARRSGTCASTPATPPRQPLSVRGTWYASTLASNQTPRAALALRRFVITREATYAALAGGGVPPGRSRPPIHITLWSGIPAK
jgi:DNA-binding transcriptional LysR family regulator